MNSYIYDIICQVLFWPCLLNLGNPHNNSIGSIIISVVQFKKRRHREGQQLTQLVQLVSDKASIESRARDPYNPESA